MAGGLQDKDWRGVRHGQAPGRRPRRSSIRRLPHSQTLAGIRRIQAACTLTQLRQLCVSHRHTYTQRAHSTGVDALLCPVSAIMVAHPHIGIPLNHCVIGLQRRKGRRSLRLKRASSRGGCGCMETSTAPQVGLTFQARRHSSQMCQLAGSER